MIKKCLSGRDLTRCGRQMNFKPDGEGKLFLPDMHGTGIFVSQTYDSGSAQTEWNRLVLDISSDAVLKAYVYLFDDYRESEEIDTLESVGRQYSALKKKAQYTSYYREMLLYGAKEGRGRFARLAIEIRAQIRQEGGAGKKPLPDRPVLEGYSLSFPKESFACYLPAIYRGNDQLDRFLAVQQSLYLELEQKIDGLAGELDYELCGRERIAGLARWMGWGGLAGTAEEGILRTLLGTGTFLTSRKGSRVYYERLAEILTGREARVIEDAEKRECILLIMGRPENGREKNLEWIRENVPMGVRMEIVILHRTDRLDGQFFLDTTACLAEYESELTEGGVSADGLRLL